MPSTRCTIRKHSTGCNAPPDGLVRLMTSNPGAGRPLPRRPKVRAMIPENTSNGMLASGSKLRHVTRASNKASNASRAGRGRTCHCAPSGTGVSGGGGSPCCRSRPALLSSPCSAIPAGPSMASQRAAMCAMAAGGCQPCARNRASAGACSAASGSCTNSCAASRAATASVPKRASSTSRAIQSTGPTAPSTATCAGSISTAACRCGACANQASRLTTPVPPASKSSSWNVASSRGSSHTTAQRLIRMPFPLRAALWCYRPGFTW